MFYGLFSNFLRLSYGIFWTRYPNIEWEKLLYEMGGTLLEITAETLFPIRALYGLTEEYWRSGEKADSAVKAINLEYVFSFQFPSVMKAEVF